MAKTYSKMKVMAGQVWAKPNFTGFNIFIIRVEGNAAYYKTSNKFDSPEYAAKLLDDGTPSDWDDGWVVEKESPASPPSTLSSKDANQLLDFFKGVPAGHCPCNILKEQCRYHR